MFFIYEHNFLRQKEKDKFLRTKLNQNFWFKDEALIFENKTDFSKATFRDEIYFNKVVFQDGVDFVGNIFENNAVFIENKFKKTCDFSRTIFKREAIFRKTIFQNEVSFFINIFQNKADFRGVIFQSNAIFKNTTFQNMVIFRETNFKNKVDFGGTKFEKEVYFKECEAVKFVLNHIYLSKETYFEINGCNFTNLIIANFINHTDNFFISNSEIDKEIETTFYNSEASLEIDNCTLNNMKFLNCDFSQAERITIKNSYIENVAFNNVDWGKISEDRINPDVLEEDPKSARDTYRQIKYALDKQADHINANWFYALEMKAYERYLKTLSWKDHFQEKLVFSIHKFISEFGISWVRPLVLIVLSTIIMLGFGIKLFPIEKIENETSTTIFGFVVDKFYYVAPLWNVDFWVIYIALATIGIYFYFYLIWKTDKVRLEKKKIGYEDAGFTFKVFNINSYKILVSLFFIALAVYIIGLLWLYSGNSLITAVLEFLDRFATTLNIFKVFSHFVGEDSSLHKLYSGYLFLYKIYAIFILVLIYQLILAIRRKVRR
ncbi:pentapeptide repeat-containing protein [Persephonella sp.]